MWAKSKWLKLYVKISFFIPRRCLAAYILQLFLYATLTILLCNSIQRDSIIYRFEQTRTVCLRATIYSMYFRLSVLCACPSAKNYPWREFDTRKTYYRPAWISRYRSLSPKRAPVVSISPRAITFAQLYRHYFRILYTESHNICTSTVTERER